MKPPPSVSATGKRRPAAGARTAAASAAKALLDLGHQAGIRIEELLLDLRPAAEVVDGELLRAYREAVALGRDLEDGAIATLREQLLPGRRVEVFHERLRRFPVLAVLGDGERIVDPDRRLRDVEVDGLAAALREQRFVLVGEERVALAGEERVERVTRRLVLHDDVVEELLQVVGRLLRRLAELELCAVRGEDVPARAARRNRVR